MEEASKKSSRQVYFAALLMGAVVFIFQSLMNRWLSVAVGATVTNQLAILFSTYLFFGLGAYGSIAWKIRRKFSHLLLFVGLALLAVSWPQLPLWFSSFLKTPSLRFFLTTIILAPFLILFGMAIPQFHHQSDEISFSKVFLCFHLGAAFFLMLWDFSLVVLLGLKNCFYLISFFTLVLIGLDLRFPQQTRDLDEDTSFTWNYQLLLVSLLNGLIQGFLLYFNNRIQGPFSISFTSYLVTSMIALALAAFWVEKAQITKEIFNVRWITLLPLGIAWSIGFSFAIPYLYELLSPETIVAQKLLRFSVVIIQFLPPLTLMALVVPAYVKSDEKDYKVIFQNSWGNVFGIVFFLILMTIIGNAKASLFLILLVFIGGFFILKKKKELVAILPLIGLVVFTPNIYFHSSFRYFENPQLMWSQLLSGNLLHSKSFFGPQVDILDLPKGKTLVIDGYKSVLLKNTLPENSHERLLGKYQADVTVNNDEALVLGIGSGATVASIAESFKTVTGVEIHPVVFKMKELFSVELLDLDKFKNVIKVFDDGHSYLGLTSKSYDLIVNNVPTPQYSAASTLWTVDFYKRVRSKLKPDGFYSQWIDGAINKEAIEVILASLRVVFAKCYFAVVTSTYGNIMCSNNDDLSFRTNIHPLVFPIKNWRDLKFIASTNSLTYPILEQRLGPFLSRSWIEKEDWFLLERLKIEKSTSESCRELKEVKSKGGRLPSFCL